MTGVVLSGVSKSFGETVVIPGVDLEIRDKEFVVLVGPSGCGKTTTLRMIAGLENVSGGRINFGVRDVTDVRPGKRNCAMVFQNYALYPHMTVAENITYGMRVRGTAKEEVAKALDEAARILGLEPYLDRQPKHLSGGQRQRVAIGRAIVRHPDVYLFDEPLSNLDAKLRIEMRVEIRELHRRLGTTMIYVTHDQVEAMTMADRVVVMNEGNVEQAADPLTLYNEPANLFVAGFIGAPSMNFLKGKVSGDRFETEGGIDMAIPDGHPAKGVASGEVVCGIRPEHMAFDKPDAAAKVRLRIKAVEPLGAHTLLAGMVGESPFIVQASAQSKAKPDEDIEVPVDMGESHFFTADTGKAIRSGQ